MRQLFIIMLLFTAFFNTSAQNVGKSTDIPLTAAVREIATVFNNKIPEQVKVVGIGDITPFAKESTDISMAIAAFLVSQKKFRDIFLLNEDWILRPLNDYLNNKSAFDSTTVDSLVRISMANSTSRTASFSAFAMWLKKYNLSHPAAKVNLRGLVPDNLISPAYFLATYIFPVDSVNGQVLAKKWGAHIYDDDELAFKDIDAWYQQISKNTRLFNRHKELLIRYVEDIDHNAIIREGTSLKMKPKIFIDVKTRAMASLILKKSAERIIIYSNNEDIAKSIYVFQGDTLVSLGLRLQEQLKDKYYACLTDFAAASSLNQMDPETGALILTTIPGTLQARELFKKKAAFFMPEDSAAIKHYQPRTIFPQIGTNKEIVPNSIIPATDALFIIKSVTPTGFLKRIRDIGDWVK